MKREWSLWASLPFFLLSAVATRADGVSLEQERVEDVRKLHRAAIAEIQDVRTLARYLKDWGGPARDPEADTLMVEAEGLYGVIRAADHGGQALQALRDAQASEARRLPRESGGDDGSSAGPPAADAGQLALVAAARRFAAADALSLYDRAVALKAELVAQVRAKAAETRPFEIVSEPMPWTDDPVREASREAGLQYGWTMDDAFFGQSDADLAYMADKAKALGARFAEVDWAAACDWAAMEPSRGVYDFAALDRAVALLAGRGMRMVPRLRTFNGAPPDWFAEEQGAACRLHVPARDNRTGGVQTNLVGINLSHEPTRAAYAAFLAAYAAHLRDTAAESIDAISIDSRVETEAVTDVSDAIAAGWRAAGNTTRWIPPEELGRGTPEFLRAEAFRERWLVESLSAVRDALKAGWPGVRVQLPVASDDFHRMIDGHTGLSRDFDALAAIPDVESTATDSPAGFVLLRSLADGRPLWNHMIHSGCGMCGSSAASHAPFYDSVHLVHGNQGRSVRALFPGSWFRYPDRQLGDSGIGNHWIAPLRMAQIAPVLLNTRPVDAEVAILWSQDSLRRSRKSTYKSAMAWGHLLQRIHTPFAYVGDARLAAELPRYRVLVLPNCQAMDDADCAIIRDWVRSGGILLGFGAPGRFAPDGTERASLPLADVFGADLAAMRQPGPVQPDKLETTHPEGCFQGGNLPPRSYKFETGLAAVLAAGDGTPRAWYDGAKTQPAIVEHRFGDGESLLCGFPLGFEYWESAPYELALGLTHHRNPNRNMEQKRYEQWVERELARRGVVRPAVLVRGRYLRSQRGDDPDWYHVYRNGPNYQEYMFEEETPVRASYCFPRRREGVDALYVGIANTEINYMWERGYFISTLAGAILTAEVAVPEAPAAGAGLVVDARLGVPVPFTAIPAREASGDQPADAARLRFATWIPAAQSAVFAVTAGGSVRLFGKTPPAGDTPEAVRARVAEASAGDVLPAGVTIHHPEEVRAYLERLREKEGVLIGCGDRRFLPAANLLAERLRTRLGVTASVTMAGARVENCRDDYMDGYGWPGYGAPPVHADILLGNCQDNGLMYGFISLQGECGWLPLEVNQDFPGMGRSLVMLSLPCLSRADGRHSARLAPGRQLVLGASQPEDCLRAVEALDW
ncbi:MAG: beta-galactosidase [Kiritimatiellia bacterium]|jgi:hypothetical protein